MLHGNDATIPYLCDSCAESLSTFCANGSPAWPTRPKVVPLRQKWHEIMNVTSWYPTVSTSPESHRLPATYG